MEIANKIKVAVFDFDDTLAIHRNKDYSKQRKEQGDLSYYTKAFLNPCTFYDNIEICTISDEAYNLISYLRLQNTKLYCLSGMCMSLHFKAKEYFVHKHYGDDIEMLSAATQKRKIDVVKILQEVNRCKPCELLVIDDRKDVVNLMAQNGFSSVLADNINNLTANGKTLLEIMDD